MKLIASLLLLAGMAAGQLPPTPRHFEWMVVEPDQVIRFNAASNGTMDGIDVPAVQDGTHQLRDDPQYTLDCGMAESLRLEGLMAACLKQVPHLICADPRRIGPFFSADGKSHCLLFGGSQ